MDSETTPSTTMPGAEPVEFGQLEATTRRVFSRSGDDGPSPAFVNNVEFTLVGTDLFMDTGIVSPEALRDTLKDLKTGGTPTVRFNVDFRFGMSLQTARMMHQRLTTVLQATVPGLQAVTAGAKFTPDVEEKRESSC